MFIPSFITGQTIVRRHLAWSMTMACMALLAACTSTPEHSPAVASPPAPPPVADLYFTPTQGQDVNQQEEDRYDCYLWSSQQSGYDPSSPYLPPGERFKVVASRSQVFTDDRAREDNAPNTPARRYRRAMSACLEGRGYSVR